MKKILICFLILICLTLSGCWWTTTNGKHSGQITAIEDNGLFWKTTSVYIKSDISSSQEEMYCLENKDLIPLLETASVNKTRVTLVYHDEFIIAPWRCSETDTGIIDKVNQN